MGGIREPFYVTIVVIAIIVNNREEDQGSPCSPVIFQSLRHMAGASGFLWVFSGRGMASKSLFSLQEKERIPTAPAPHLEIFQIKIDRKPN